MCSFIRVGKSYAHMWLLLSCRTLNRIVKYFWNILWQAIPQNDADALYTLLSLVCYILDRLLTYVGYPLRHFVLLFSFPFVISGMNEILKPTKPVDDHATLSNLMHPLFTCRIWNRCLRHIVNTFWRISSPISMTRQIIIKHPSIPLFKNQLFIEKRIHYMSLFEAVLDNRNATTALYPHNMQCLSVSLLRNTSLLLVIQIKS